MGKQTKAELALARTIIDRLKEEGFRIFRSDSFSTNSIYMKVDAGVCHSITIRDHPGLKKYQYKHNVFTNLDESYMEKGRHYYAPQDVDLLINTLCSYRQSLIRRHGQEWYDNSIIEKGLENIGKKGFWSLYQEE